MKAERTPGRFGRTAATLSWVVPIGCMVGTGLVGSLHAPLVMLLWSAVASLAILASAGLGIAALTRITNDGRRGILVPALIGLSIDALLVVCAVSGVVLR
jgi:hypothetical protein